MRANAQTSLETGQTSISSLRKQGGGGIPSWVAKDNLGNPALMTLDAANDRGWFNGQVYASEAAFLAAIGGSKSGVARTIGPYVDPAAPELVVNGDFAAGLGTWTALSTALASVVNGELVLDGNGVTNASVESPSIPVTVGKAYQFKAKYRRGTSVNAATIIASTNANLSPALNGLPNNSTTSDVVNTGGFAAEGTTAYLALRIPVAGATGTVIADELTLKEATPMAGWSPGKDALIVDFVSPPSNASIKAICTLEDGASASNRNKVKVYVDTDAHLKMAVTTAGTLRSTTDLGAVSPNTAYSVHFTSANNRMFVALDGQLPMLVNGFVTEGVYVVYLGRSFAGETLDGSISRASVFASEFVPARAILSNGDSFVGGVAGASVPAGLIAAGRAATVGIGQGGSALAAQLGYLQAAPGMTNGVYIHWDGDYNGYGTLAADMALYAQMIALLGHQRFVIIPPCVRANSADKAAPTVALAAALKAAYPSNVYDAQAYLATLSDGSAGDIAAVAAGQIPPSCLQADLTHLTVTAMNATMANMKTTVIDVKGW